MIKIHHVSDIQKIREDMDKKVKSKILAFVAIFIWATSYMGTKIALKYLDSPSLVTDRYFLTVIALVIYMIMEKMRLPDVKDVPYFVLSGLFGFSIYMIFFNKGIGLVSTGTTSVIIASAPIFTVVLSRIIFKEKLSYSSWCFIIISFVGILILTLWEGIFTLNIGVFYLFIPAVSMAFYNILQKRFVKKYTPSEATSYSMLAGGLLLILYSPKSIPDILDMKVKLFLLLLYLALFVGVFGYILWSKAFAYAEYMGDVVNFMFLTPILVVIMGVVFLKEKITYPTIIGGLLILLGILGYNKIKNKSD